MNPRFAKFTTGKPKKPFKCKLCEKTYPVNKQIHKIVFGRRRWYNVCQECVPDWIIFKRE